MDLPELPAEPRYEVVGIHMWRRFVLGGEGPELTLAEAAAALGVSVATVRKLIRRGRIVARRTQSGGYRIVPVARSGEKDLAPAAAITREDLSRLWQELRESRARLVEVEAEREGLRLRIAELDQELAGARTQIGDVWQLLKDGSKSPEPEELPALLSAGVNQPGTAERVRGVIIDYRALFKRRRRIAER
jgi:excisionase family DNA binding protein